MNEYKNEVEVLLEYYLELPFNLSLPTGDYPLNIPRQIRIRRDMYFLQKGNEIMNLSTLQRRIEPQDRLFDDRGLVDDKFSDFTFIRKMKTVIFAHYKIPLKLIITIEVFENMLRKGEITEKNLLIKKEMLLGYYKRFKREINEFLSFYSSFFPTNDIKNLIQHEVRPLSSYEFSKCESGIIFNYNNIGVQFAPIIEDSGNLLGIPDSTYPYELNKDKFAQFEQLMINRKMYQLLSYQKMFHLARSLYRTNKNDMTSIIIINALTSLETLFNILEKIESDFEKFKKLRKKEKINGKKKKV